MNTPIIIPMLDNLVHELPERPWCSDLTCPCHNDMTLIGTYLYPRIQQGISLAEAKAIWRGETAALEADRGLLSRQRTQRMSRLGSIHDAPTDPDLPAL